MTAAFLAGTPEALTYDFDGNLTSDGRFAYSYDAENRVSYVQTTAAATTAGHPAIAASLFYDYLGRRIRKVDTVAGVSTDRRYVYHGWNLIAEYYGPYNGGNFPVGNARHAFWGLDLSGTLQGAGGVGGLLMVQEDGNSYLPAYDALGNVHGMIKASDGTLAAAYEYDAFGNTLRESGPYAASNPFRYSTKYTDIETGLVQYNTRYYAPSLGRFINRDSIGEQGGINLYAYVGNNGVNKWDYLGQVDYTRTRTDGSTYYDYGGYVYGGEFVSYSNVGVATRGGTSYGSGVTLNPAGPADYLVTFPDGSKAIVTAASDAEAVAIATRQAAPQPAPNNGGSGPREGETRQGGYADGSQTWTMTWHNNGPEGPAWYNDALGAPNRGLLRQPEYATSTITGRTHRVGTSPGYPGDPVFAGQVKDAALGFVVGDIMDGIALLNPNSSNRDRLIAAGSLIAGLGPLPNVGPGIRAGLNPLQDALARARPVGDRLEAVLDDGSKVIFRRDVGPNAHPLPGHPNPVDHWNVEVHQPIPGRPGRFEQVHNTHIIIDSAGNPTSVINSPGP